jgi:tetratricopeptide (TPR) repeat protein
MLVAAAALLGTLLAAPPVAAQEPAEWYRDRVAEAIRSERYDRAVDLLQEAQRHYDGDPEFFMRLGDLYYGEELYALALEEYREAEDRAPGTYEVLDAVAFTLGLLNREEESADHWHRLAELFPDRIEPAQNLGWLLFKLHRLDEGVAFLLDAWDRFGPDADLAMTLGTIHAERYDFAEARDWYRRSIELAASEESDSFVAVALYNLSLIQKLFHRYEEALESTQESISILPRPTGYLARGELHELRLDFAAAHNDYLRAYDMDDDTPLGRLNLALLYQRFGRLDEALAFATSVFQEEDSSWLYYYGTDVTRHRMELHDLLADIHDGLARRAGMRITVGPIDWLTKAWDVVRHRVLRWYHRSRFQGYAGTVGRRILEGGNLIDANWYLYRASENHRRVAASYLRRARQLEVAAIPESAPYYETERAMLQSDTDRLLSLAAGLTSPWQRRLLEDTLVGALEGARRPRSDELVRAAIDLYRINRGALRQHGIALPVRLSIEAERARDARLAGRMLRRAGFVVAGYESSYVPRLNVTVAPDRVAARLLMPTGTVAAEAARADRSRSALATAVNELAESIFLVQ